MRITQKRLRAILVISYLRFVYFHIGLNVFHVAAVEENVWLWTESNTLVVWSMYLYKWKDKLRRFNIHWFLTCK